ncbi:hypothetical protein DACRYDRAFT_107067 [Dacryopinax primogenitus]|uniref:Uncharacterized protein n=1 Tax=Dacryopinax primogenitus (strain DJM 731) TaxID=1858805 RepID=M5FW72_DACPD|nr:uncharacterized protein DACRYDRAFT_107067 [Dacryopinax primogenitus]EJU02126.1 hypothetical protein DACRYDRAFT_107067 [Dacryopinax primogenitus]
MMNEEDDQQKSLSNEVWRMGADYRRSCEMFGHLSALLIYRYAAKAQKSAIQLLELSNADAELVPVLHSVAFEIAWTPLKQLDDLIDTLVDGGNNAYCAIHREVMRGFDKTLDDDYAYISFLLPSIHVCIKIPCSCGEGMLYGPECLLPMIGDAQDDRVVSEEPTGSIRPRFLYSRCHPRPELPFSGMLLHPLIISLYALIFDPKDAIEVFSNIDIETLFTQLAYIATLLVAAVKGERPAGERGETSSFPYSQFYLSLSLEYHTGSLEECAQFITYFGVEVGVRMRLMQEVDP